MHQVKIALSTTTSHGLPRVVSNKPFYIRVAWLLLYLFMLCLFLKSLVEFATKLKSQKVTTSIESEGNTFQFPDVYACFENPVSGSYSTRINQQAASVINASFDLWEAKYRAYMKSVNISEEIANQKVKDQSLMFLHSIPYKIMFDELAHRVEQSVISSSITYIKESGEPGFVVIEPNEFNHPLYLRCIQWTINSTWQEKMTAADSWAGLTLTLLLDTNSSFVESTGHQLLRKTFFPCGAELPVSDWLLSIKGYTEADRVAGLKVFLSPPGEYPSDFVSSFSLGPGKFYTVEIEMTQNEMAKNQFKCIQNHPEVAFTNPYDLSPYSHAYSYSFCYYFHYHQQTQELINISGNINPQPWSLRAASYLYNLTGEHNYLKAKLTPELPFELAKFTQKIRNACQEKRLCSTLDYSASISSADWPTRSSLTAFINSSVKHAWVRARDRNLSVPALDFLMTGNASSVASYVRSNLLKVHLKPRCVKCKKVTFSIEYGFSSFISEVGGVMGIYLGMSLLTLCELLELLYNITAGHCCSKKTVGTSKDPQTTVDGGSSASSRSSIVPALSMED